MGAETIRAIQSIANPFWDAFFQAVTSLGEEPFYMLVISVWYWCVDKGQALRLAWIFFLSVGVNGLLKTVFAAPRPIGAAGIRSLRLETAAGHSFPSGHTQNAAAFQAALARLVRRAWFGWCAAGLVGLIGLSRLYLGLHWPFDVAGGLAVGLACAWAGNRLLDRLGLPGPAWIAAAGLGASLAGLLLFSSPEHVKIAGALAGVAGGLLVEPRFIGFSPRTGALRQAAKILVGLGVLAAIQQGLKLWPGSLPVHFVRYALIGFWSMAGAPWLFMRLRLSVRTQTAAGCSSR